MRSGARGEFQGGSFRGGGKGGGISFPPTPSCRRCRSQDDASRSVWTGRRTRAQRTPDMSVATAATPHCSCRIQYAMTGPDAPRARDSKLGALHKSSDAHAAAPPLKLLLGGSGSGGCGCPSGRLQAPRALCGIHAPGHTRVCAPVSSSDGTCGARAASAKPPMLAGSCRDASAPVAPVTSGSGAHGSSSFVR
eukprot:353438-Chlamydomonas_euryale.AAC.8